MRRISGLFTFWGSRKQVTCCGCCDCAHCTDESTCKGCDSSCVDYPGCSDLWEACEPEDQCRLGERRLLDLP